MRRSFLAAGLGSALLLAGCGPMPQQQQFSGNRGPGCDTSFEVANRTNQTVRELYFSQSALNDWGRDQLGERVLGPGDTMRFRANHAGNYDFRVVWANGRGAELRNVNVCRAAVVNVFGNGLRAD
ncbi:hypothetical protein C8P66_101329 [Humitalea rosea]|uniref:Lipoprotein n=1 Tax=Humitalea rosea TaxID=990373 RepID=A0A2W7KRA2_9PROT|nr:hypothetical protein [Humitalea rosea]PZW51110.1 hypothetical protein C8P66_101329 [Humitalea rosea]